ncbi:MAG: radical SAM protein [Acidobacteria bacterium]|nr:MAG: radical SAM protein [Acidobacteriota bacterium]
MENLLPTPGFNFVSPVRVDPGAQTGPHANTTASSPFVARESPGSLHASSCNRVPEPAKLVGIARLAQSSPRVRERTGVEYFSLPARSALNRESSGRMPFAWTLNPYRGCEFGCKYCYARYTHEFMELHDGLEFERKIFAKLGSPELLRAELRRARDGGLPIALGTATDPYQPAEKQFEVTRGMLKVLGEFEDLDFSITTKSTLILRDIDLLVPLARRHRLNVHITVTTVDSGLARLMEPKAPPPIMRLEAVRHLVSAGIRTGVNAAPIIPGLTDSPTQLEHLARAASEHGAQFLLGMVLFLMPSAMAQFMPFLEKQRPDLVRRYRKLYRHSAYLPAEYKDSISTLVTELRARYGLDGRREESAIAPLHRQYALAFA